MLLQFLPCYVFAHGEQALFALFLPIILGIIFILALSIIQLSSRSKTILIFIYAFALLLSFVVTMGWPYSGNDDVINLLILLTAPVTAFFAYFLLLRKDKALRRKKYGTFLNGQKSNADKTGKEEG
jgi:hypothetical protein